MLCGRAPESCDLLPGDAAYDLGVAVCFLALGVATCSVGVTLVCAALSRGVAGAGTNRYWFGSG